MKVFPSKDLRVFISFAESAEKSRLFEKREKKETKKKIYKDLWDKVGSKVEDNC